MTDFKAGDRVRVVDARGAHEARVGDVGTVIRVYGNYETLLEILLDDGLTYAMCDYRFELVSREPKYKPGDKVRRIGETIDDVIEGEVYTVHAYNPSNPLSELQLEEPRKSTINGKSFRNWAAQKFEPFTPTYDFRPGDVVVPKSGSYGPDTIVGYYEDGHKQYPNLPAPYASVPIVVYKDDNDGHPSWDRASEVVLHSRPENTVVEVEAAPPVPKPKWKTVSKQLVSGALEVRIQVRKVVK